MKRIAILLVAFVVALPALAASKTVALDVKGWTCGSCAVSTRIALKKLDGVENVSTNHEKSEAVVTYDEAVVTPEALIQAIQRVGYSATIKASASAAAVPVSAPDEPVVEADLRPEEVSFFKVPLECGAASDLGCGSSAKPILRELEQDSRVAMAKINRPGTMLAVSWKDPAQAPSGIRFVMSTFDKSESEATTLRGPARESALRELKAGQWYGPAEVDRLSEHEAEVIASRLITRAHLGLATEVEKALTHDLSAVFAKHLTSDSPSDRGIVEEELVAAAGKYLNPEQMDQLRKAGEQGVRALPGEAK